MFSVTHFVCGKPAFLIIEAPEDGQVVKRAYVRHLDRTRMPPDQQPVCDSCGGEVARRNLSRVYLKRIRVNDRLKA